MMIKIFQKLALVGLALLPLSAQAGYDKPYVGEMVTHKALHEDTFVHLARDYNLGFTEMRAANPYVDPWLPGAGEKLTLPTRHLIPDGPREGVLINVADMRLYAFINGDNAPYHTPIGVGREGLNTPMGTTTITRKKEGPTWTPTKRMRDEDPELKPFYPPGADNPLGTHALYLGWPTYAMHGTNRPFGIGRRISSGCIRIYPEKIVELYKLLPVGTKVTVVNQPIKLAWIGNELFIEAHPTLDQAVAMEEMGEVPEEKLTDEDMKRILKVAGTAEERLRWPTIRKALKERSGFPVAIARRPSVEVVDDEVVKRNGEFKKGEVPLEYRDMIEGYVPPPSPVRVVQDGQLAALNSSATLQTSHQTRPQTRPVPIIQKPQGEPQYIVEKASAAPPQKILVNTRTNTNQPRNNNIRNNARVDTPRTGLQNVAINAPVLNAVDTMTSNVSTKPIIAKSHPQGITESVFNTANP